MDETTLLKTEVVVIGAGLTGLTTAYYLQKQHKPFMVLEKLPRIGGVIQSTHENGFLYENGPNTGVIGNTAVVELFEELEAAGKCRVETGGKNVSKRFILKNAKWECMPLGPISAIRTPLFSFYDKLRILGEPFRRVGNNPNESLAAFVKRRMGQSFLDYAIDPFISGVYAGNPNYLVTRHAVPKIYNLEQTYGSLIGGSIKKGFKEKKTELEKRVTRKTFSMKEGLSKLTEALHESAGKEHFVTGVKNLIVEPIQGGFHVRYENESGERFEVQCAQLISTTGAFALEQMMPFISAERMQKIDSLVYTKVIEVALGFNKWEGIKLDGFGGLIPSKEKRDILGVLYMSSLFEGRAPESGALLSVFLGGVRRQDIMLLNDEGIKKLVEGEMKALMGVKTFNPDLIKILRHNHAIPQYGHDSAERWKILDQLEKDYPGLQLGGNMRDGIGMADRIKQGRELAEKAL